MPNAPTLSLQKRERQGWATRGVDIENTAEDAERAEVFFYAFVLIPSVLCVLGG